MIFRFLLHGICTSRMRSIGIILIFILSTIFTWSLLFLSSNISDFISEYTMQGIDEKRVTLTASSNIFDLLDRTKGGIDEKTIDQIRRDSDISRYNIFTFVDIPVLAKFDLFGFGLETDVPVFSLYDSREAFQGVGIPTSMLQYYNLEFAGSHPMFPHLDEKSLIRKGVKLTFGASKLFPAFGTGVVPLTEKITRLDPDFPGFGIVISDTLARENMKKLGYVPREPYRVVFFMNEGASIPALRERYKNFTLIFDADTIEKKRTDFSVWFRFMTVFSIGVTVVLWSYIMLLFLGYFRERRHVFILSSLFHIPFFRRQLLLFFEPGLLLLGAAGISMFMILGLQAWVVAFGTKFLLSHGIEFGLSPISLTLLLLILFAHLTLLFLVLLISAGRQK